MDKLIVPLAYKYVAIAVMLAEANYCAERLHLQMSFPIVQTNLNRAYVNRPLVSGFGGSIETTNYAFSFHSRVKDSGRLRYISKVTPQNWGLSIREKNLELSRQKSQIDTTGAYHLATQWLASISISVEDL